MATSKRGNIQGDKRPGALSIDFELLLQFDGTQRHLTFDTQWDHVIVVLPILAFGFTQLDANVTRSRSQELLVKALDLLPHGITGTQKGLREYVEHIVGWKHAFEERSKSWVEEESCCEVLVAVPKVQKWNLSNCCYGTWADQEGVVGGSAHSRDHHLHYIPAASAVV